MASTYFSFLKGIHVSLIGLTVYTSTKLFIKLFISEVFSRLNSTLYGTKYYVSPTSIGEKVGEMCCSNHMKWEQST